MDFILLVFTIVGGIICTLGAFFAVLYVGIALVDLSRRYTSYWDDLIDFALHKRRARNKARGDYRGVED